MSLLPARVPALPKSMKGRDRLYAHVANKHLVLRISMHWAVQRDRGTWWKRAETHQM